VIAALAFFLVGGALATLGLTPYPRRVLAFVLQKLKMAGELEPRSLDKKTFFWAFFWKFVTNLLSWTEIYAILLLLDVPNASIAATVAVGALIASTSV